MSARGFTNPNFGTQVRVEQWGREVHLIFVGATEAKASDLVDNILAQLKVPKWSACIVRGSHGGDVRLRKAGRTMHQGRF